MTREKAIKAIKDIFDNGGNIGCSARYGIALDMAIEALKQPEQKKGRWVKQTELSESICSNCKKAPKTLFGYSPNYCPNCGAEMENGEVHQ